MRKSNIWNVANLPPLRVGDCLAFEAQGIQKPLMKICGAKSWHWAMVGKKVSWEEVLKTEELLGFPLGLSLPQRFTMVYDYQVVDSTSKGITHHLLSEYQHRNMRVYRPVFLYQPSVQGNLEDYILYLYLYYGMRPYDYLGVVAVALWWILNHVGIKTDWWGHSQKSFWCMELPSEILSKCNQPLVPANQPPYPYNMENSERLELIWGTY